MARTKSPLRTALIDLVVPWAERTGFDVRSPYLMHRPRLDIGATEIIEVQWSVKHPYRRCTVNLGLYHPDFGSRPEDEKELAPVHCPRRLRLGHLMSRNTWLRVSTWYRYSSKWDYWQIIPPYGDFWWRYGDSLDMATPAVTNMLSHMSTDGLAWFRNLRQYTSLADVFDRQNYEVYEGGAVVPVREPTKSAA